MALDALSDFYLSLERKKIKHDEYIYNIKKKLVKLISSEISLEYVESDSWMSDIIDLLVEIEVYNKTIEVLMSSKQDELLVNDLQLATIQVPPEDIRRSILKKWLCAIFGC